MIGETISHYRVIDRLGRGGMGEVYRAEDLKLGRIVALKFLTTDLGRDAQAKVRFIHEAKAASALDHPNICTIHGIEEADDGQLFIAMACYEGQTLENRIAEGPMSVGDALYVIAQAAEGLSKAHSLGILHRDLKPANLFLTEDGLVKILDFGIAKLVGETQVTQPGTLLGTLAYMSPEQVRGEETDRRTDVWSLGVILYEMLTGQRPFVGANPQAVLHGILESDPTPLTDLRADVPADLVDIVDHCLRKSAPERTSSAEELLLQLAPLERSHSGSDTVTRTTNLRQLTERRDVQPYPGLSSFSQADAEFFHGRESQVEALWRRLRDGRLLGIAGPSGVGKTSFLHAGVLPAKPDSWGIMVAKPCGSPFVSLREALVRELSGDTEAIVALLRENDLDTDVTTVRRWRQRHDDAVLILDQFEELFTLCPVEEQTRFAELLSRLILEADVRVLVSMRDDFLSRCHEHAGLAPVVDGLTILTPLSGQALRHALTQPAVDCGYRFDDDSLVDEMISSVEGERGSLPLLAFTMASLWDRRDRENGMLTRASYEEIGGVSGALAQHAESVMVDIGSERNSIVRELFRNLVTAEGTRNVLDREQLLSVFEGPERTAADEVLGQLTDARLLTTYEIKDEDGTSHHRVEIVHESLLHAWPRLVRWQTQDAEGAQLRDQLRQAAHLWEQRNRSEDLLWTGTAFREFELWQERYPGAVTETEESFAQAMRSRNERQRKRRRIAVSAAFVALLAVLGVVGIMQRRAEFHARASDAQRLAMLADETMDVDNTVALALATASLDRADSPDARLLALKALWRAPVRSVLTVPDTLLGHRSAILSPDSRLLATVNEDGVLLWPRDGSTPVSLESESSTPPFRTHELEFHPDGGLLVARRAPQRLSENRDNPGGVKFTLWSIPDRQRVRSWTTSFEGLWNAAPRGTPPTIYIAGRDPSFQWGGWYSTDPTSDEILPNADLPPDPWWSEIDSAGEYIYVVADQEVLRTRVAGRNNHAPQVVARHESRIYRFVFNSGQDHIATGDAEGTMRVWALDDADSPTMLSEHSVSGYLPAVVALEPSAERLVFHIGNANTQMGLIDCDHPQAQPVIFGPRGSFSGLTSFTSDGDWFVYPWVDDRFNGGDQVFFYPMAKSWPAVYQTMEASEDLGGAGFSSDGKTLITVGSRGDFQSHLVETESPESIDLWQTPTRACGYASLDPTGRFLLVNAFSISDMRAWMVPLDGSAVVDLDTLQGGLGGVALESNGRRAAVAGSWRRRRMPDEALIRVIDLETRQEQVLRGDGESGFFGVCFVPDNQLLSWGNDGLHLWDLATGGFELLSSKPYLFDSALSSDGEVLVLHAEDGLVLWNLESRTERVLPIEYSFASGLALSPDASFLVAGTEAGEVLVLDLDAGTPHVLLGHDEWVFSVWISADGEEIRSASSDGTVRIWERPRGKPVHDLPHEEFLALLRAQTNMRAVPDLTSDEGYRIEYDKFPGWAELPPEW